MSNQSVPTLDEPLSAEMPCSESMVEAALWTTARRFQALIEHSSDIVLILDVNGILRYSSPSTTTLLGYSSEKLVGKNMLDIIHPADNKTVLAAFRKSLKKSPAELLEFEYRVRHNNGSWLTMAATVKNLLDNPTVAGFLVNCHDITKRKQAEKALRESETLFRQVVSSITDHIYMTIVTADGQHINHYVSPNIEELTGYPRENFKNDRGFWPNQVIHPDDRAAAADQSQRLDQGESSEMEYRLVRANGSVVWVRDSGRVEVQPSHKIIYGIVSDITNRRRLEEQLRQAHKLESVGRLAGGISHNFNNLLTVIIGNSELLLDCLPSDSPHYSDVQHINRAAARAASLTRQLLTFSRNLMVQPKLLNLNQTIEDVSHVIYRLVGEKIQLVTRLEQNLWCVKADPGQMEQVIINLVANATEAMPTGGTLTLETSNVQIDDTSARQYVDLKPGPYIRLLVSDTGHSMDEDTRSRIFEPFFTTKEQGQGLGLGLATVHGIVNQSNGHIWVESQPHQGTTFFVYLPPQRESC